MQDSRTPRLVEHFWVPILGASCSNKLFVGTLRPSHRGVCSDVAMEGCKGEKLRWPIRANLLALFAQSTLKGTNLRGQTEPKRRFLQILAFSWKQSIWET